MDPKANSTSPAQLQNPVAPVGTGVKKSILIVDDEPDARELFAELLKTNPDYVVEVASDGNEALQHAEKTKFDLILLDIVMPNLDGVDTLATIKGSSDKYGNPVVIMLTNIGGDIAIQEAIKLGAIGYKLKIDTEPEELLQTVSQALDGKALPPNQDKELRSPDLKVMAPPTTPETAAPASAPADSAPAATEEKPAA